MFDRYSRRQMLQQTSAGFGAVAAGRLLRRRWRNVSGLPADAAAEEDASRTEGDTSSSGTCLEAFRTSIRTIQKPILEEVPRQADAREARTD